VFGFGQQPVELRFVAGAVAELFAPALQPVAAELAAETVQSLGPVVPEFLALPAPS